MAEIQTDTQKWFDEVGSLVGETNVLFYPHGERPDGDDWQKTGEVFQYLQSQGFRIFCSVGIESFSYIKKDISAVICDRLHPDGTTLRSKYVDERYGQFLRRPGDHRPGRAAGSRGGMVLTEDCVTHLDRRNIP